MEEDRFLDIIDETRRAVRRFSYSLLIIFLSSLCACSLPRIIILDDPLSPEEHINLGVAYEGKGELDNALKEYRSASDKLPRAFLYMGNIYFRKEKFDDAEVCYKKAIREDPKSADAYNNLAWIYYARGKNLDEAETLVSKAIELEPAKRGIYQDTLDKIRILKNSSR